MDRVYVLLRWKQAGAMKHSHSVETLFPPPSDDDRTYPPMRIPTMPGQRRAPTPCASKPAATHGYINVPPATPKKPYVNIDTGDPVIQRGRANQMAAQSKLYENL